MGYILHYLIGFYVIVFYEDKKALGFCNLMLDMQNSLPTLSNTKKLFSPANLINNKFAYTNIDNRLKQRMKVAKLSVGWLCK